MRKILVRYARASLARICLTVEQYSLFSCNEKKWFGLQKLVAANQFISGKFQNKVVANNS